MVHLSTDTRSTLSCIVTRFLVMQDLLLFNNQLASSIPADWHLPATLQVCVKHFCYNLVVYALPAVAYHVFLVAVPLRKSCPPCAWQQGENFVASYVQCLHAGV